MSEPVPPIGTQISALAEPAPSLWPAHGAGCRLGGGRTDLERTQVGDTAALPDSIQLAGRTMNNYTRGAVRFTERDTYRADNRMVRVPLPSADGHRPARGRGRR